MTLVHPVLTAQNHVVADVLDLWVIVLAWGDVDILERPIKARRFLGTVHPYHSVLGGCTCEVG